MMVTLQYTVFLMQIFLKRGLGKNLIIQTILTLKNKKVPYLYLGYWIKDSNKMNYKIFFIVLSFSKMEIG